MSLLGALPLPRKMPKRLTAQSRRDVLARRPAESCRATAKRNKKNEREREREREREIQRGDRETERKRERAK